MKKYHCLQVVQIIYLFNLLPYQLVISWVYLIYKYISVVVILHVEHVLELDNSNVLHVEIIFDNQLTIILIEHSDVMHVSMAFIESRISVYPALNSALHVHFQIKLVL